MRRDAAFTIVKTASRRLRKTHAARRRIYSLMHPTPIRKAIIPAAGLGTRLFPASWAVKKEFFPVITPAGDAKPLILTIVEEVVQAGIEEVAIIIRPDAEPDFARLFTREFDPDFITRLPADARAHCDRIQDLSRRITLIPQKRQEGFGHAVHCTANWVGNEPYILLLGDHYYGSHNKLSCTRQMLRAFSETGGRSVIGASYTPCDNAPHYGIMAGSPMPKNDGLFKLRAFQEKPAVDYARQNLTTPGTPDDHLLCVFGIYALTPRIYEILAQDIRNDNRLRGEIQLTTALDQLRNDEGMFALRIDGFQYDIGRPKTYLDALNKIVGR